MLEKIISGGQSGADRAGWRAAKAFGVSSGGWMPRGILTDDGPHPEFADQFGANVAGNREDEEPGIGDRVERFLGEVLQQLDHDRA